MEITDKEIIQLIYFKMRHDLPYKYNDVKENVKHSYFAFDYCLYPIKYYEYLINYIYIHVSVENHLLIIKLVKRPFDTIQNISNKKAKLANDIYETIIKHLYINDNKEVFNKYIQTAVYAHVNSLDECINNIADFILKINEIINMIPSLKQEKWDKIGIKKGAKVFLYDERGQLFDKNNNEIYGIYLGNNIIKSNGIIGEAGSVADMLINKYRPYIVKTEDLNGDWYWYYNNIAVGEYAL